MTAFVRVRWLKRAHEDFLACIQSTDAPKDSALAAIFRDSGWSNHADVRDGKIMDWCGMSVAAWLYRGGGLQEAHRKSFWATGGVESFFTYGASGSHRRTITTLNGAPIKSVHADAGSLRKWTPAASLRALPLSKWDVQAGDVVLIAHKGQTTGADHIAMIDHWDGRYLATYEGNASGIMSNGLKTSSGVVRKTRDLQNTTVKNTIYGIGRLSRLDYAQARV